MKASKVKESELIKLTEEEIKIVQEYQKVIESEKASLGNLRLQFLMGEKSLINRIEKAQNDFFSHVKMLSQGKDIPTTGDWLFDPSAYVFRKKS